MQDSLKIAILQSEIVWEDPEMNRINFSKKIDSVSEKVDLFILPEMFTTGFTMSPEKVSESMTGKTMLWLKRIAKNKDTAITGSLIIKESHVYYNRLVFVFPDGRVQTYDKRHTFSLAGEDKIYASGNNKLVVSYKNWKICPMICYDLRFPVWARNTENYDVLVYVANWPEPRISAWDTLLKARAIENMSYCIGVNRVGKDDNNHEYTGHSAVYDVFGQKMTAFKPGETKTEIIKLNKENLLKSRTRFKFLNDKDSFMLIDHS
jgi:predicted amidohydrolase